MLIALRGFTASALLVLGLMTGLGVVGFLDDFIKIRKNRSLGLTTGAKLLGQLVVGTAFAILALRFKNRHGLTPGLGAHLVRARRRVPRHRHDGGRASSSGRS